MKRIRKVSIQSISKRKYLWAFRMFFIAICMSMFFGFLSQTMLSSMGVIIASLGIALFIFIAVLFDMLGIAATSADIATFKQWEYEKVVGADIGVKLLQHSEKVCSFCADVVGDICSTLCGAGGACIVVALTNKVTNSNLIMLISITTSAFIAGITIFFKAIMKEKALKNSNKIILKLSQFLNNFFKL